MWEETQDVCEVKINKLHIKNREDFKLSKKATKENEQSDFCFNCSSHDIFKLHMENHGLRC